MKELAFYTRERWPKAKCWPHKEDTPKYVARKWPPGQKRQWIDGSMIIKKSLIFSSNGNTIRPHLLHPCVHPANVNPNTKTKRSQPSCQTGRALRCQRGGGGWGGTAQSVSPACGPSALLVWCGVLNPLLPLPTWIPDNRSRPYYSSRLVGGYLCLWQPVCCKSEKPGEGWCVQACV